MAKKHYILFITLIVMLVPILLALPPMKMMQKLAGVCPCGNCKQMASSVSQIFNVLTSQSYVDDVAATGLSSVFAFRGLVMSILGQNISDAVYMTSNYLSEAPPLRC